MRKFFVEFKYNGFVFTAMVYINRIGKSIIYTTKLYEDFFGYMFFNKELIFMKEREGYSLVIFTPATPTTQMNCQMLDWHIRSEFVGKTDFDREKEFSKS